jgi:hypothetical protein
MIIVGFHIRFSQSESQINILFFKISVKKRIEFFLKNCVKNDENVTQFCL